MGKKKLLKDENDLGVIPDMLAEDLGEDTQIALPSKEKIKELVRLVDSYRAYEEKIKKMQDELSELTAEFNKIQMESIPDLFDELQMKKFVLTDGTGVEVKSGFVGSISEANRNRAHAWLEKNGHAALIKHDFVVKLGKGEKEVAKEVREDLDIIGVGYTEKEHVHHQTLKAFINEQMEQGVDIPEKLFNIFPVRKAIIK